MGFETCVGSTGSQESFENSCPELKNLGPSLSLRQDARQNGAYYRNTDIERCASKKGLIRRRLCLWLQTNLHTSVLVTSVCTRANRKIALKCRP